MELGKDVPNYVMDTASPGYQFCLITQRTTTCGTSNPGVARLCACSPPLSPGERQVPERGQRLPPPRTQRLWRAAGQGSGPAGAENVRVALVKEILEARQRVRPEGTEAAAGKGPLDVSVPLDGGGGEGEPSGSGGGSGDGEASSAIGGNAGSDGGVGGNEASSGSGGDGVSSNLLLAAAGAAGAAEAGSTGGSDAGRAADVSNSGRTIMASEAGGRGSSERSLEVRGVGSIGMARKRLVGCGRTMSGSGHRVCRRS